jgi:hypothetical protein
MERLSQENEDLRIQLQRVHPISRDGRRGVAANLADLIDDESDVPVSFKHVALTAHCFWILIILRMMNQILL